MKLMLKSNGVIHDVKVNKYPDGAIESVELTFDSAELYSDMEFWLTDDKVKSVYDHATMNVSRRCHMRFHKT